MKGHTTMSNLADKIVGKELENLGVIVKPIATVITLPTERKTTVVTKPTYDTRHKHFKTENARHKMVDKFTSENPSWSKDWACEVGAKMRQEFWECAQGSCEATIDNKKLTEIIELCHKDIGQLLDHLGIVFKTSGNEKFKSMLSDIIKEEAIFNNGSMNRNIKVIDS